MHDIERKGLRMLRNGNHSGAVRYVVKSVAGVAEEPGEDTVAYLEASYRGAKVLAASGDVDAAISLMNTVPKEVAEDPANAPTVAALALEIGEGLRRMGDAQTAERVVGLSHDLRRKAFGPHHPKTGLSALMAARTCFDLGRYGDAHKFFEAGVVGLGPYHPFNAVAYADRAFVVQLVAPEGAPFPEFVMSAPRPYWRRLLTHMADTTLHMPLDLRLAVLLNVSTEVEDNCDDAEDLTRPLLESAYRHAKEAGDERVEVLEEIFEERGWEFCPTTPDPNGAASESFWRSPDRDTEGEMGEQEALFKLFEGAAEASAGHSEQARAAFERVADARSDQTLEHWAAKGCLQLMDRGWKLRHQQFKPEMRAIEARALSKLPKATRAKVQGIEMAVHAGSMDLAFLGKKLTEPQQKRAVKVVQDALAWVTERSEDAA